METSVTVASDQIKEIYLAGLDIHKIHTQIVFIDSKGMKVKSIRIPSGQVTTLFSNHAPIKIGIEVCMGSQYLAKQLEKLGHSVKVMNPQKIKAFYTGPKNDQQDALAIAQAALMEFVSGIQLKPDDALVIQGIISRWRVI